MGVTTGPPRNRTIAVASGKGGVGKTVITANLAVGLAERLSSSADSVVAVDLDLGCGNLNACLGVRSHRGTINNFLASRQLGLSEILTPTEQPNLQMICSSYSGAPEMELADGVKTGLLTEIRGLEAAFVLLDLGAGTSADVLDLFLGADERIMVITPESLSLHNAFVFLKTAVLRYVWRETGKEEFLAALHSTWLEAISHPEKVNIRTSIEAIRKWDRYSAFVVRGLIDELKIKFVVNKYRDSSEDIHIRSFHELLQKHLCLRNNLTYLGAVHYDQKVRRSIQGIRPFLLSYPDSRAARQIAEASHRLATGTELDSPPSLELPEEKDDSPVRYPVLAAVSQNSGSENSPASRSQAHGKDPTEGAGDEGAERESDPAEFFSAEVSNPSLAPLPDLAAGHTDSGQEGDGPERAAVPDEPVPAVEQEQAPRGWRSALVSGVLGRLTRPASANQTTAPVGNGTVAEADKGSEPTLSCPPFVEAGGSEEDDVWQVADRLAMLPRSASPDDVLEIVEDLADKESKG